MGASSSTPKISSQDKAILDLKLQRDKLHAYQKQLHHLTDLETTAARTFLSRRDRPRALLALRRKKYQETLLSRTDAQLAQLQLLTQDVEFALVQKDVLFGLERGAECLREIRKEMGGLEGVERAMERGEEERAFVGEVAGVLARGEEEEVEEELEGLEREAGVGVGAEEKGKKTSLPNVPDAETPERLPDAPANVPTAFERGVKQRQQQKQEAIAA